MGCGGEAVVAVRHFCTYKLTCSTRRATLYCHNWDDIGLGHSHTVPQDSEATADRRNFVQKLCTVQKVSQPTLAVQTVQYEDAIQILANNFFDR